MQKKKRNYICLILTIIWMMVIFLFSARPAELSTQDSNWIGEKVGHILIRDFAEWDRQEQLQFAQKIDYPIRKTAHATEYAILGLLILGWYADEENRKKTIKIQIFVPWLLGTMYAASDEFHQLFVPGRSGQISDVILDSTGVLVGVLVGSFLMVWYNRITKGKERK